MWRYIIIAVSLAGMATQVPALLQTRIDTTGQSGRTDDARSGAPSAGQAAPSGPAAGRMATIEADGRGHFVAQARLNGRAMDVLVDTGATLVAINESTARRIGIRLNREDFRHEVRTANGTTRVAAAVIDEIRIGRITVRDVPATVSDDDSLQVVLLGMSFLRMLKKFEVESGRLLLAQ